MPTLSYGFVGLPFIALFVGVIFVAFNFSEDAAKQKTGFFVGLTLGILALVFIIIVPIALASLGLMFYFGWFINSKIGKRIDFEKSEISLLNFSYLKDKLVNFRFIFKVKENFGKGFFYGIVFNENMKIIKILIVLI